MKALSNISNRIAFTWSWTEAFLGGRFDRATQTLSLCPLPFFAVTIRFGKIAAKELCGLPFTPGELRLYLLDVAPDAKQEEISEWIISTKSSEYVMEIAEDVLIDDYLRNLLSEGERILFEKRFLSNEARVRHLQQNVLLKNFYRRDETRFTTVNN